MRKYKILLLADFSNAEVRGYLDFWPDNCIYKTLIKMFHLPSRVGELSDHAPWIPAIIGAMEEHSDIDLYVASPQIRLKKSLESFELRGVRYYFFRSEITSLLRLVNRYGIWKYLEQSGKYVKRILNQVKPDLVVLSGSENPTISVSALSAKGYPRICLCQTIYNNPQRAAYSKPVRLNSQVEKELFKEIEYYGVHCKMHYDLLKAIKPDAIVFKFNYPYKRMRLNRVVTDKCYDFVNFALSLDFRKGADDSIQALAIVKKKYPQVTLNLVGGCDDMRRKQLDDLIEKLDLKENVFFTPFFEKRSDLFLHIQKSRFAVLPCKLDNISGTMAQAMELEIPIVVYRTAGTPSLNKEKECALIAEHSNVDDLASKMLILMDSPEMADQLRKNAREYQEKVLKESCLFGDKLVKDFKTIIANYYEGAQIITDQLFNPNKDE